MEEVKRRTAVIFALLNGDVRVVYRATHVESMVLQVRMITELIALGSLAAHRTLFELNQRKFQQHWHPGKILKDIASLNPDFYPRPVVEVPSADPKIKRQLVDRSGDFMTPDELVEIHGRCGNLLHARNPFDRPLDRVQFEEMVPRWMERIMNLLNTHQIKLLSDDYFYLVHMKEEDDKVHMYTFERQGA